MNARRSLRALTLCAGLITATALSGCGTMLAVPPAASENAPMETGQNNIYLLSPGDTIKVTVYGDENLTGQYVIDKRGIVSVPMIGEVQAAGLTPNDLRGKIGDALVSGGFYAKPLVTIDMISTRPFFILGEVKNPGSYPYQPSLDALQAIAVAGGYSPRAAKGEILIDRRRDGQLLHLNATEATPILPGDSITVRQRIL